MVTKQHGHQMTVVVGSAFNSQQIPIRWALDLRTTLGLAVAQKVGRKPSIIRIEVFQDVVLAENSSEFPDQVRYLLFTNWDALMDFMMRGLEIGPYAKPP